MYGNTVVYSIKMTSSDQFVNMMSHDVNDVTVIKKKTDVIF